MSERDGRLANLCEATRDDVERLEDESHFVIVDCPICGWPASEHPVGKATVYLNPQQLPASVPAGTEEGER